MRGKKDELLCCVCSLSLGSPGKPNVKDTYLLNIQTTFLGQWGFVSRITSQEREQHPPGKGLQGLFPHDTDESPKGQKTIGYYF